MWYFQDTLPSRFSTDELCKPIKNCYNCITVNNPTDDGILWPLIVAGVRDFLT